MIVTHLLDPADPVPAIVLGLGLGFGLTLIVYAVPIWRRPSLTSRLAPYLRDQPRTSRLLDAAAVPSAAFGPFTPWLNDIGAWLSRVFHGSAKRRLDRLGTKMTPEHFRAEQVMYAAAGLLTGLASGLLLAAARGQPGPGRRAACGRRCRRRGPAARSFVDPRCGQT